MRATLTAISDVVIIEPKVFGDERGFFFESFNHKAFEAAIGKTVNFVQDNHSRSAKGVLRGMHYQIQQPQGKLVRVVQGDVFDVAVDNSKSSTYFGRWVDSLLSAENKRQFWVPGGFAHCFKELSDKADFLYKATDYYAPADDECCLNCSDPATGIQWPIQGASSLSAMDLFGRGFDRAECFV